MVQIIVILAVLGLCAGSFVNALVWRLHEQSKKKSTVGNQESTVDSRQATAKNKNLRGLWARLGYKLRATGYGLRTNNNQLSILYGRSVCPNCRRQLAWYDNIPLASWLILGGRCRYCRKPISLQYPLVELTAALVFTLSYIFWPAAVSQGGQWLLLATWLTAAIGLLALAVYDLRWMLLPTRIIYPTLAVAVLGRALYLIVYETHPLRALVLWFLSVVIASGVFLALFMFSKGKWIGYGDVRLGLVTGTLLADPNKSLAMLFVASVIGSLAVLPALFKGNKTMSSKLPYGPFLIIGTAIIILFGDSLLNWYKSLIL